MSIELTSQIFKTKGTVHLKECFNKLKTDYLHTLYIYKIYLFGVQTC